MQHVRSSLKGVFVLEHPGNPSGIVETDFLESIPIGSKCTDSISGDLYIYRGSTSWEKQEVVDISGKVDKVPGKGLSTNDFTDDDRTKLDILEENPFRGEFIDLASLQNDYPVGQTGWYAFVDAGIGQDLEHWVWDETDSNWIRVGSATVETPATIKSKYEANPNTNAFTDQEKSKLSGIEDGATKDQDAIEIKNLYESNGDTNVFNDANKIKLDLIDPNPSFSASEISFDDSSVNDANGNNVQDSIVNLDQKVSQVESIIPVNSSELDYSPSSSTNYPSTINSTKDALDQNNIIANSKQDAEPGKGLSTEDFTTAEKNKLSTLEESKFQGQFTSLANLQASIPVGQIGWHAFVDMGVGEDLKTYAWDDSDSSWVAQDSNIAAETPSSIKLKYESNANTNEFTDGEKSKLGGIELNATADQTSLEIKNLYESEPDTNAFTDTEKSKLQNIELNATADQTPLEIKNDYESNVDTNVFTDSEKLKLSLIEDSATSDQTPIEIKTSYESNSNTNAFTDLEKSKLANLEESKFQGNYNSLSQLQTAVPSGMPGWYAHVDLGVGQSVVTYNWDVDDAEWVQESGTTTSETPVSVKTKYESNTDTNAFTDSEKSKLASIEVDSKDDQNANEVPIAFTPNNYSPNSNDVESYLSAIDDSLENATGLRGKPVNSLVELQALEARDFEIRRVDNVGEFKFLLGATSGDYQDDLNTGFWFEQSAVEEDISIMSIGRNGATGSWPNNGVAPIGVAAQPIIEGNRFSLDGNTIVIQAGARVKISGPDGGFFTTGAGANRHYWVLEGQSSVYRPSDSISTYGNCISVQQGGSNVTHQRAILEFTPISETRIQLRSVSSNNNFNLDQNNGLITCEVIGGRQFVLPDSVGVVNDLSNPNVDEVLSTQGVQNGLDDKISIGTTVTQHNDVNDSGSGNIITAQERTDINSSIGVHSDVELSGVIPLAGWLLKWNGTAFIPAMLEYGFYKGNPVINTIANNPLSNSPLNFDFNFQRPGDYKIMFEFNYSSDSTTQDFIARPLVDGQTLTTRVNGEVIREEAKDSVGNDGDGRGTDQKKAFSNSYHYSTNVVGIKNIRLDHFPSANNTEAAVWDLCITVEEIYSPQIKNN